jgi:hypothetical protein
MKHRHQDVLASSIERIKHTRSRMGLYVHVLLSGIGVEKHIRQVAAQRELLRICQPQPCSALGSADMSGMIPTSSGHRWW